MGGNAHCSLTISFMEAANGCTKDVDVDVAGKCETCDGTGSADKEKPVTCTACRGTGSQTMRQGFFVVNTTCQKCGGAGTVIKNPCRKCNAEGVVLKRKTVKVNVPPGVDSGINMRMSGQGHAGQMGGRHGDLYVSLQVEPDPFFHRDGVDITVEIPITISQAILGTTVNVPTIKGEVELKVPAGTQPKDKLVMRGRGLPRLGGGSRGNQYVTFNIEIPKKLTAKQEELIKAFAEEETKIGADKPSFFQETLERVRKMVKGS